MPVLSISYSPKIIYEIICLHNITYISVDSTWMWEFVNEVDDEVKRCQEKQFGCDPKTFWADGQPSDGVTQFMFGLLNVYDPRYPDPQKNWVAGTGEGGNQVGYICGPKVEG